MIQNRRESVHVGKADVATQELYVKLRDAISLLGTNISFNFEPDRYIGVQADGRKFATIKVNPHHLKIWVDATRGQLVDVGNRTNLTSVGRTMQLTSLSDIDYALDLVRQVYSNTATS